MTYFQYFPLMAYDIKGTQEYKLLPQIIKRVKLRSGIRSGVFLFDKYDVKDGEKPEDVAFKWYGDAGLHWVILMTNNITDAFYDWPMSEQTFETFLEDKYTNPGAIHHYEVTKSSGKTTASGPDDYSYLIEVNSDATGAQSVSNREYEQRLQDEKRKIKLLNESYLSSFIEEFNNLVRK